MSNHKAEILTEAELDSAANMYPYHIEFVERPYCCGHCQGKRKAQELLARYKGERT